ncbi:hypothetical protein PSP31120_02694 [Pandoraea sputorum]|nr:hypothetical protein PSP31120_02694 [Pandoraea sputorum]
MARRQAIGVNPENTIYVIAFSRFSDGLYLRRMLSMASGFTRKRDPGCPRSPFPFLRSRVLTARAPCHS